MAASVGATTAAVKKVATRIRLMNQGCANRPFYHIVVTQKGRKVYATPIEQIGTYDPLPNRHNEKLVSINVERLKYWIAQGSFVSDSAGKLLGLSGFLPIHPRTYLNARRRQASEAARVAEAAKEQQEAPSDNMKVQEKVSNDVDAIENKDKKSDVEDNKNSKE